ncbi:hypothetical protein BKK47_11855 [Rodentibacter mrazii]|uniref:Uncharacterized protein n=1 Tax=Rodentibacter mrazii TaxID=1908257 RepID=A0A1V3I7F5_9PAST|nr:hypothetical protein [Rodentibacter mrazii]OOF35969.1 hypothetical protein BKK47_11855 [Rodentibacter mrazii]
MNYGLIAILLFLISTNLIHGLEGKNKKEKIKTILLFLCFFLLFGAFMVYFNIAINDLLENPIIKK